jgi:serine/threonine kinase 16
MESIIVHWLIQVEEERVIEQSSFVLSIQTGAELYLLDILLYFHESGSLPSLCYNFYGLIDRSPVPLYSPSSVLPVSADFQVRILLIPARTPPMVRSNHIMPFTKYSREVLYGKAKADNNPRNRSDINTRKHDESKTRRMEKEPAVDTLTNVAFGVGSAAKSLWGVASSALGKVAANMHAASGATVKVGNTSVVIERELAEGGFGTLFVVRDGNNAKDKKYAMKQVLCQSTEQLNDTKKEISALKRFQNNENIISLHDFSSQETMSQAHANGTRVVMMLFPLYQSGTLWDKIEEAGGCEKEGCPWPISERYALDLCAGIASGLHVIHERGFSHRDVKPHNILLTESGVPIITDFGSVTEARRTVTCRRDALNVEEEAANKTSPASRAPELTCTPSEITIDERVDVWGLGCTLFCMAFGRSPFETPREGVLRLAIINGAYNFPERNKHRNIVFSPGITTLIDDMLAHKWSDRPFAQEIMHRCPLLNKTPNSALKVGGVHDTSGSGTGVNAFTTDAGNVADLLFDT